MYQEAIKYSLKVCGTSVVLTLAFIFTTLGVGSASYVVHNLSDFLLKLGLPSLIGFTLVVLFYRMKFNSIKKIKWLLTGILGTLLLIALYVQFSTSIGFTILPIFLISMIIGTWYFKFPKERVVLDRSEEHEDILDA